MSQLAQETVSYPDAFEELQRECEGYATARRAETELRLRLVNEMKPLLKLLKRPVTLSLRMRGTLPEALKLMVGPDFSIKVTHARGGSGTLPSLSLEEAFVATVRAATAKIEEEVARRRARELASTRPRLRAELRAEKNRIPIFGRWKYRLVVFNVGGDALSVALTTKYGSKERSYDGLEIRGGGSVDCELRDYKARSSLEDVSVDLECSDSRMTRYLGAAKLPWVGSNRSIKLTEPGMRKDRSGEE